MAALVSQLRDGSRSLLAMSDTVSAEVQASLKLAYAAPMADTSALSHEELEKIMVTMR